MKIFIKTLFLFVITAITTQTFAAMDLRAARGEKTVNFTSPSGNTEFCIVPQKIKDSSFSESDIKTETKLCDINFYENTLVCAKQNSTNPGLLIGDLIPNYTKAQAEAKFCKGPADAFKTEAKFKQSISCSYTPSILAYYQFSRLLNAGRVPVAVVRTMDREEHVKHTHLALTYGLAGAIKSTWSNFSKAHESATNKNLFDDSGSFVYGALTDNPKGEFRYTEVSGGGAYETRYQRFLLQSPFLRVANPHSVEEIAGGSNFAKVIPIVTQMKDVSDMILLDTLFSQDDRIGNIHFKYAWYWIDEAGKIQRKKSQATLAKAGPIIPPEEKTEFAGKATLVREMLMKDNDCGVDVKIRSNMMRKISAIEKVRHMSAKTYGRLINFAKVAKTPETESWMQNEMLFTTQDLKGTAKSFQSNLDYAVKVLTDNCKSGSLKLDLNPEDFVPNAAKIHMGCDGQVIQ
jgi:hypothetical protein